MSSCSRDTVPRRAYAAWVASVTSLAASSVDLSLRFPHLPFGEDLSLLCGAREPLPYDSLEDLAGSV
jgi:hypothetical protein